MIVKTNCDSDRSFYSTIRGRGGPPQRGRGRGGGGRQPGARPRGLHRRQGRAVIEWRFSINSCYSYLDLVIYKTVKISIRWKVFAIGVKSGDIQVCCNFSAETHSQLGRS